MIRHGLYLFVTAIALLVTLGARAETVDAVLAVVDKEPILQSDLMTTIAPDMNLLAKSGKSHKEMQKQFDKLLRKALDDAINNKILLRQAQLSGIKVTDDEIDERIQKIKKLYKSNEAFLADLKKSGETMSDIRDRVRKQVMAITMAHKKLEEFQKQVVVSESEVAQYYQDHIDDYKRPERVRVRQIFLEAGKKPAERAKVRARMEQLLKQLDAGANFAELAAAHSEALGAKQGGVIGWTMRGDLVEPLNKTAFSLGVGKHSGILETPNGFHILYVEAREPAGTASLDEVRTEIEPKLRQQKVQKHYQQWLAEQRKRSRIQIFM